MLLSREYQIKAAKENYTAKFSEQLTKAEKSSVRDFYKFYNDQYDQASAMFIRQGALSATDVSVFFNDTDLINMYTEMYSKIGLHFALWYYKNVDKLLEKASDLDNLMSIWQKSFAFVGQQVGAQRVTLVSGTAKNTLIAVTQKLMSDPAFMNQGEKVKAKILKTQFNKYSTYQSKRLVRTEATNAANYATIESALTVFEGGDLMKTWHTSIDGRERLSHGSANGQTVPTAGKFSVQGQFLKWAGDPAGSASNVINCRCGVSVFPKPNAQTTGENITDIGFGVARAQVQSAITEALITPEVAATIVAETISVESNAKTIKEAEQWAVDNNLAKFVNYSNFDVENANKANNALKMVFNDFNIDPLDYIDSGKFRATTSTLAQANGRLLEINQKVYSKEKIISTFKSSVSNWTAGLEKRLELLDSYIGSPLYNAKKLAKALKETKKSLMYERHNVFTSEFIYSFNATHTIRFEFQHMSADHRFIDSLGVDQPRELDSLGKTIHPKLDNNNGNWIYALAEYTIAPAWFISVFNEYNYGNEDPDRRLNYLSGNIIYVKDALRISMGYGRVRGGILCVGGVCRPVPASNGFSLSISSTF